MFVPDRNDMQVWTRMNSRMKPCPDFPKDLRVESYRTWRMLFVHWVCQMREIGVCESLWGPSFLAALKGGANGVHEAAILVNPESSAMGVARASVLVR